MDWLVVILVVTALAMIGVITLIHRGRVRIWSICMILLGLGIGIVLYTQISIFKSWQTALYIVFSVVLALVLVYLFAVLGMRRQKTQRPDKSPEESDVLATASREPMRLSDWEAVIAYSAAPAKANKEIRRVNASKMVESTSPISLTSAAFTPSLQVEDSNVEGEEMAADAIASFFRESAAMPVSAVRLDAALHSTQAVKSEERKPYPEPVRVSSSNAKPMEPVPAEEDDVAFESLSFRVVRDKSAQSVSAVSSQKKPDAESGPAPKTSVTKESSAAEQEKTAPSPVYKVHKPFAAAVEEKPLAQEQDQAEATLAVSMETLLEAFSEPLEPVAAKEEETFATAEPELGISNMDDLSETQPETRHVNEEPQEPVAVFETVQPAADEYEGPALEEAFELAKDEPASVEELLPAILHEEPQEFETQPSIAIEADPDLVAIPPVEHETSAEAEPAAVEIEPAAAEFKSTAVEIEPAISEFEPVAVVTPEPEALSPAAIFIDTELPPVPAEQPVAEKPENGYELQFAGGMTDLNTLIAAKEYRNAQALIFDLLRMEYQPTDEEKRRLLLVMKLLKEKEKTNAEARNR